MMMDKPEPNWVDIIPEFLAITEDMALPKSPKTQEIRFNSSKELVITEAKKLIRHEKFQQLGERKKEKILTREINQFRDNLEMARNLNRMQLEAAEEQIQIGKKHRQIRALTTKTITHDPIKKPSITEYPEPQKSLKICNKKKSITPNIEPIKPQQKNIPIAEVKPQNCEEKSVEVTPRPTKAELPKKPSVIRKQPEKKNSQHIKNYVDHKAKLYYWTKWKIFVAAKKKEKNDEKVLREKINNFMQRLHERSQHQNKSEEEKTVRRKTAPAKSTLLVDPDLQEISDAIEKSALDTRNQLRSKSVQSLRPGLKTKATLIRLITAAPATEEEITREPIQYPPPQVLIEMNRKHDERKQRLEEIQERKRKIEEEKDRIVKEKYEQQLFEAEQEKRRKIREFREKLRKERIEQEKRQQEWIRLKDLNRAVLLHYERKLVIKFGLNPLKRLVEYRRRKNKEAIEFNEKRIMRAQFGVWKEALQQILDEKTTKALALRAKQLLKTCLNTWRQVCFTRAQQLQVAQDWHEFVLVRDTFQAWLDYIYKEQREQQDKWEQAVRFYKMNLLRKCLKHWMLLPQVLYLEREKEHRKKAWREKVQQVLPDFTPITITNEL